MKFLFKLLLLPFILVFHVLKVLAMLVYQIWVFILDSISIALLLIGVFIVLSFILAL